MARPDASLRITGLNETLRDLTRVGVEASELKVAMNKGAQVLSDQLRNQVPKKTGLLASTVKPNKAKGRATATIGGARPKHYAVFVNYGHQSYTGDDFARRALRISRIPAVRAIEQELTFIINRHGF